MTPAPSVIPHTGPVARAPAVLRVAVEAAAEAFRVDPTQANWALLSAAVTACIDHDDRQRSAAA